jgi:hypothetical protein
MKYAIANHYSSQAECRLAIGCYLNAFVFLYLTNEKIILDESVVRIYICVSRIDLFQINHEKIFGFQFLYSIQLYLWTRNGTDCWTCRKFSLLNERKS